MKKERQSNFELLRIISMLLIISFHYVFKSGYVVNNLTINNYIIKMFWLVGEIGVNLFVLISGYFLVKSKFSLKKVILLLAEVIFYNSISAILAQVTGTESIFRILYSPYSFVRMYIILYFLSPFINRLIENISKKEYQYILLICIFVWSILPTFLGIMKNSTESLDFYSRMIWFVVMYLIGGYIRIYNIKSLNSKKRSLIASMLFATILFSSIGIINIIKLFIPRLENLELAYLWGPNNIISLLFSVSLFMLFANINIGYNKVVNKIASTTLGIYMIHDGLLRNYLWKNIFHTKEILASNYAIIGIVLTTLILFSGGGIIDLFRQYIEKHTVKKYLEKNSIDDFSEKINVKFNNILDKIL